MSPELKHGVDVVAYSTTVATLIGWLPAVASLFTVIWLAIQITEKITGKPFAELVRCAFSRFRP